MNSQSQLDFANVMHALKSVTRRDYSNAVKLSKYKKIAESMLKKDPPCAHTLLGSLACLEHDLDAMHLHHKSAIEAFESCLTLFSYAESLERSCLWSEATRYALLAIDHNPEDTAVLEMAIRLAPLSGRFSLLKRLLPQWQQLNEGTAPHHEGAPERVAAMLAQNGLVERDLKAALTAVGDALSATDIIIRHFDYEIASESEGYDFLHYRLVVADDLETTRYEDVIDSKLKGVELHPRLFDVFSWSIENTATYELYQYLEKDMEGDDNAVRVPDPDMMKLIEELIEGVET